VYETATPRLPVHTARSASASSPALQGRCRESRTSPRRCAPTTTGSARRLVSPSGVRQAQGLFRALVSGLTLHAAVRCAANDRQALEQLCRYITRPALANERVQTNAAGQVVLKLKTPWRDGTTHLVMSPLEFMQRLAALVPRPRLHLIRFHGVLAPNAKLRAQVVPQEVPQEAEAPAQAAPPAECEPNCAHHRPVRLSWAAQARVRDRHGALPELRRRAQDHRGHPVG